MGNGQGAYRIVHALGRRNKSTIHLFKLAGWQVLNCGI